MPGFAISLRTSSVHAAARETHVANSDDVKSLIGEEKRSGIFAVESSELAKWQRTGS